MKSIIAIAAGILAFALTLSFAHAAPTATTNVNGTVVYGSEQAVSLEKDTSAGYNRTIVRYSSGAQYVNDDDAWSKFAKLASGFFIPVASGAKLYDISKTNGIYCTNGQSVVSFPNVGPSDTINDGCALFNAAKAAAN